MHTKSESTGSARDVGLIPDPPVLLEALFKGGLPIADLKELTRKFIAEVWNHGRFDLL